MKKINIIKKNEEYHRIIQSIRPYKYNDYLIYLEKNNDPSYHFGFSVSKKIGNAVTRNRIKRQLKSILDKKDYQNGFNCIIMVRKSILTSDYQKMEEELTFLIQKLQIIKEK